jgi:tRNA pseudouridine38-40 synthase
LDQGRELRNIRLTVAYDGTGYCGWQIQKDKPTIQGTLARALERITGATVNLIGSGRTDAGTHARALVANFQTPSSIEPGSLVRALNSCLPRDIRVLAARVAPLRFNARRDALGKIYRYQIFQGDVLPPHLVREYFHYPYPVDLAAMRRASGYFVGAHDFAAFAARSGRSAPEKQPASGTIRVVYRCDLKKQGPKLILTIHGNGFLHHMVRNIAGTLLEAGRGRLSPGQIPSIFEKRDRTLAGFTAPAHGLVLVRVIYRPPSCRVSTPNFEL